MQELAVNQPKNAAVQRVNGQHDMQIIAAAALRTDDRGVLDRQHLTPAAALGCPQTGLGDHFLDADRRVAQKPGQPDFPGPIPAQRPDTNRPPALLQKPPQKKGPPFCRRRSPNRPSESSIARSESNSTQRIRHPRGFQ